MKQSEKLGMVCYDIRGPVLERAKQLEEEGHRILKLNIGNPAVFGLNAPDEIIQDVIRNLPSAEGYCDSKGLFSARKAIMQECQRLGIMDVDIAAETTNLAKQQILVQASASMVAQANSANQVALMLLQ